MLNLYLTWNEVQDCIYLQENITFIVCDLSQNQHKIKHKVYSTVVYNNSVLQMCLPWL